MNAKWMLTTTETGIDLVYHNLVDNIVFECGQNPTPDIKAYVQFAVDQGAGIGDKIYLDGVEICEVLLNKETAHVKTYN